MVGSGTEKLKKKSRWNANIRELFGAELLWMSSAHVNIAFFDYLIPHVVGEAL
jgi:hypothetical protein